MEKTNIWKKINRYRGAIMGFAALWIYFFHEWNPVFDNFGPLHRIEVFVKTIGFGGVDIFFFLSGMGLIYAIEKYDVLTFYKRRLVRVALPYLVTAVAMLLIEGWGIELFLKNLLGWNFFTVSIYSLLWFVPAILLLYLLFPAYYSFFRRIPGKFLFTVAVLAVWLCLSVGLNGVMRYDLYGFTNRIPVFVIGILAGWLSRERETVFSPLHWLVCVAAFGAGLFFAYLTNYRGMFLLVPVSNCCVPNLLMAPSACFLLATALSFLDESLGLIGRGIVTVFRFMGKFSLEFYCVQEWVAGMVKPLVEMRFGDLMTNGIVFVCVLAATLVLDGLCQWMKKLGKKGSDLLAARLSL